MLFGVSKGSVLGPCLFNIFLCNLFLLIKDVDIDSYADENTPCFVRDYIVGDNKDQVISALQNDVASRVN